ncbi:MAG TPA: PP2C family protein-serine/threonine phosphatase [Solirubrobacteraceae bacterium]|nr:PP2C family protein-serine/threonine phosphatase [Solirubrobacteraceae bacterium]
MSRRALAILAAACGALGMQSLPAAVAAKSDAAGETVSAATRKAERAAARAEATIPPPPTEASAPPPPPAHARKAQAEAPAGPPSTAPATHREERAHRRAAQTTQAANATAGGGAASVAPVGAEAAGGEVEALARKTKKGSGGEKGSKKEHKNKEKGKGKKGTQPEEEASGTQGSGGEGAEGEGGSGASVKSKASLSADEPAQAAVAAALSLPAATPTSGTGTASIDSALPAAKTGLDASAGVHRVGGKARRHGHKRATHAVAAAATPLALAAATTTAPGGATHGASATPTKRAAHKTSQPALERTLTKIVGVVPTPVRILIVALIALALLLGARSLFSGVRTRRLLRQRGQLLEDVGLLQAALLPEPPPRLGPVTTSAAYRPADGPGAGGDFYDVFALADGEIAVIVGDVSGHGREALPHTALLRFTVRAYLEAGMSPRRALQTAGEVLERQLAGSFATVIAATYNPREGKLTYASAGHPPPVVLGEDGSTPALTTACSAPPIGTGVRTGTRETVVSVPGPARLCFHTDGVTEARVQGELFGSERLAEALTDLDRDADATALLADVAERTDARPDDMAACLLRVHDGEGAPAVALEQLELGRGLVVPAERARVSRFLADCGVPAAEAREILSAACERLEQVSTVLLELRHEGGGRAVVTLLQDNVIHAPALAIAGAS